MKGNSSLKRYLLILRLLEQGNGASFQRITGYLAEHDFDDISTRSIRRDLQALRYEYMVEIRYNKADNTYFIDRESSGERYRQLLRFLELSHTADTLQELFKRGTSSDKIVSMDSDTAFRGIQYLEWLIKAIERKNIILFNHFNYQKNKLQENYRMEPYHLKEYRNRWYLIGFSYTHREIRTFGLDRLENLRTDGNYGQPAEFFDAASFFENTIGVSLQKGRPEKVLLSFDSFAGQYVRALPLHHSQKVTDEQSESILVELFVVPNYELVMQLLAYGSAVKVIEPLSLKEKLKEEFRKSFDHE